MHCLFFSGVLNLSGYACFYVNYDSVCHDVYLKIATCTLPEVSDGDAASEIVRTTTLPVADDAVCTALKY